MTPQLEYFSAAWANYSNKHLQTLDKVNNQVLMVITGAMKSTPLPEMQKVTNVHTLMYIHLEETSKQ